MHIVFDEKNSFLDFGSKHKFKKKIIASKYDNFPHTLSCSEMHVDCVYNLFGAVWCSFEQKQGVQRYKYRYDPSLIHLVASTFTTIQRDRGHWLRSR